jgi:hypothetical protein
MAVFLVSLQAADSKTYLKREIYPHANEDVPLFRTATDFAVIDEDLFVLDNLQHQVQKYRVKDGKLKYIKTIGQRGVGPGDFNLPRSLSVWKGVIAVKDEIGISFFDKDGKFLTKFRLFTPRISFVYTNDRIYYASADPDRSDLIDVYEKNGKLLTSFFKKFLKIDPKIHKDPPGNILFVLKFLFDGQIISDGKYIYFFSSTFGQAFKFDMSGNELLKKDTLPYFGKEGEFVFEKNNDYLKGGLKRNKNNAYSVYQLFKNLCLCKDKIYILGFGMGISNLDKIEKKPYDDCILVMDKNTLNLEKTYWIRLDSEEYIYSFAAGEKNGKIIFYTAMQTKEDNDIVGFKE